jgi:DNA-binding MarR family transcriptional regulator
MRKLTRSEIAVWMVLYRDARGQVARTSMNDMAQRGGVNPRTAVRAVKGLVGRGLLEVLKRGGLGRGPSVYRVHPLPPVEAPTALRRDAG